MRITRTLFLVSAILFISVQRLPAPIQEIPESPTPAPSPRLTPPPPISPPLAPSPNPSAQPPETSWDRPHIYLQIANESQRKLASQLGQRLRKSGYVVMGIQNVAGNEGIPTESSELRFFTQGDSAEAQRILSEVAPFFRNGGVVADLPEAVPHVSHARQYEIWFSSAFH